MLSRWQAYFLAFILRTTASPSVIRAISLLCVVCSFRMETLLNSLLSYRGVPALSLSCLGFRSRTHGHSFFLLSAASCSLSPPSCLFYVLYPKHFTHRSSLCSWLSPTLGRQSPQSTHQPLPSSGIMHKCLSNFQCY